MSQRGMKEVHFENDILESLLGSGEYVQSRPDDFDLTYGLDTGRLFEFIQETQASEWAQIVSRYGGNDIKAREGFLDRLSRQIAKDGTIAVLRDGVKDQMVKVRLVFFRPPTSMNTTLEAGYAANRVSVIRQFRYSPRHANTIDVALFVNGLLVATAELKNPLTGQNVEHAKEQYRVDRDPTADPFLTRALVHFAVDPYFVFMTTRLAGNSTEFLPFNQGRDGGMGNPDNPNGYATAYLWESIWSRSAWLDILARFVMNDGEGGVVFPRYHQWDAVTKLESDARQHGAGRSYLVQHSAGSGKSKSIAWLAHHLSTLHNSADRKVFDKIIVITDRRVLDEQLRQDVLQFERVQGVVQAVIGQGGTKSTELAEALVSLDSRIVVTTLQTFPFVLDLIDSDELKKRSWAVIIDEAHSSQTGDGAAALRQAIGSGATLSGGLDPESPLAELLEARGHQANVSFFAFTATPKRKTVEVFGTARPDGLKGPFHLYSMRQAIEEGFIVDVLANFTSYRTYYRFATAEGAEDREVDRTRAGAALRRMLVTHPDVISQKARIIVEHYRAHTAHELGGLAKAMVVTDSRVAAVRYKRAIDEYISEVGYDDVKALVAFSGTVVDDIAGDVTESLLNGFPESQTADRFKGTDPYSPGDYQVMVVAEKFQTGFDEPRLHTMFVDKVLTGLAVVQTLSRLNRRATGKDSVFVLDFRNDPDDIRRAFQDYYEATTAIPTDINALTDAYDRVLRFGVMSDDEVRVVVDTYFVAGEGSVGKVYAAFAPVLARFDDLDPDAQAEFRGALQGYTSLYGFLSQVLAWTDVDAERLFLYCKALAKLLPPIPSGRLDIGSDVLLTHLRIEGRPEQALTLMPGEGRTGTAFPGGGGGRQHSPIFVELGQITDELNQTFGTNLDERDQVVLDLLVMTWMKDESLRKIAKANDLTNFGLEFNRAFIEGINENEERIRDLYGLLYSDDAFRKKLFDWFLERVYNTLRGQP